MGGNDDDESAFQPHRGKPMDLNDMKIEVAKMRERIASQRADVTSHDAEFTKVWSVMEKLADRITNLEKKIIFASGLAAGGGALAGQAIGYLFKP